MHRKFIDFSAIEYNGLLLSVSGEHCVSLNIPVILEVDQIEFHNSWHWMLSDRELGRWPSYQGPLLYSNVTGDCPIIPSGALLIYLCFSP